MNAACLLFVQCIRSRRPHNQEIDNEPDIDCMRKILMRAADHERLLTELVRTINSDWADIISATVTNGTFRDGLMGTPMSFDTLVERVRLARMSDDDAAIMLCVILENSLHPRHHHQRAIASPKRPRLSSPSFSIWSSDVVHPPAYAASTSAPPNDYSYDDFSPQQTVAAVYPPVSSHNTARAPVLFPSAASEQPPLPPLPTSTPVAASAAAAAAAAVAP